MGHRIALNSVQPDLDGHMYANTHANGTMILFTAQDIWQIDGAVACNWQSHVRVTRYKCDILPAASLKTGISALFD